ncbi:protein-L-isoaspartate(D-aspartate) O-methyltransferase [Haladaptatus litoreus]|uniref:Protein-L-isoaspartate O-methyltransferase n=1 Tax=Haladaptatus litoreus TaxID=553468 RepID=A0A1N6VAN2_9EURY|nr:protein-L-isoaspartate(D-aspartate) O-methyltransferase [Haladaptatus litoreus]SIQ74779.1 protein-L-isoaspartate(D-aspartate) O-methyltransferase [Haladaptatus litoreus]
MFDRGNGGFEDERESLVAQLADRDRIRRETTLNALRSVPRHEFVPRHRQREAYDDRPLPIGNNQTISVPHMVAVMTDLLELSPGDRVPEIGTGCGYHAAVTAEIVGPENVFSIEYHESLAQATRDRFRRLSQSGRFDYDDISIRVTDGHDGWPEHAPYDAVYLTCATPDFPSTVVEQVRPGGRLLAPLGDDPQELVLAEKQDDGSLAREPHGFVRFVPMQGE